MADGTAELETLREEVLDGLAEFQRLDDLSQEIRRAVDHRNPTFEKGAWRRLRAYRDDVDEDDVDLDDFQARRPDIRDELAAADGEVSAKRDALEDALVDRLRDVIDRRCEADATKREQVIALKRTLQSDLRTDLVAAAVGCSRSHAGNFRWNDEEEAVVLQDARQKRDANQFSAAQKEEIRRRDGERCVNCGAADDLRVHHVIRVDDGGTDDVENGATLCKSCHDELHSGGHGYGDEYDTIEEFWEWADG